MSLALPLLGLWLQVNPEDVSWWLPHSATLRGVLWVVALALNLLVLLWVLHKLMFRGKEWSIPQALRERGEGIRTQLADAERAHQDAAARLGAIEARIANLPAELAALAAEAEAEAAAEYQRLVDASRQEAERVRHQGQRELEAAGKLAQKELKALAAALAVDLATQRIQERLTAAQDEAVVRAALAGMGPRPN